VSLRNMILKKFPWRIIYFLQITVGTLVYTAYCINGDIAFQWKWSKFDAILKQNPLIDYD